ncbi:hypothetical protein Q9L58_009908 [Maublancomyces gigas]|uniref:Uncharacterized protein n=1 Tax=Discina gigas TaxID=1032678 RepID=A0ABR3G691_9PEZI
MAHAHAHRSSRSRTRSSMRSPDTSPGRAWCRSNKHATPSTSRYDGSSSLNTKTTSSSSPRRKATATSCSAGADLQYRAGGYIAVITELLRYNPLLEDPGGNNESPLHTAAWCGHQDAVDLLLAAGCDRNSLGRHKSSLLLAAIIANLETTAIACIDQTGERELTEEEPQHHTTHVRARHRSHRRPASPHLCSLRHRCLAHGAPVNKVDGIHKCTASSVAVAAGKSEIVEYLLAEGADPNVGPK